MVIMRVNMAELTRLLPSQIDEYVRSRLKAEGFDTSTDMVMKIISYEDLLMGDIVFEQDTKYEIGSGS